MRLRSFAAVVVLCSAALAADEPSVSEQLRALFELHQQGGLTAGEFTEAKAAVLRPPVRAVPDSSLPRPGAYTYNVLDYGAD
eukprot:COSAG03_NODE_24055_length_275_cov_0.585227_1_plen_81_part_10